MRHLLIAALVLLTACSEPPASNSAPPTPAGEIGAALNSFRASQGRSSVSRNGQLDRAARLHAEDMAGNGFMAHTGSDGSSPADRVTRTGYQWCWVAENVARGQPDVDTVVAVWAGSPGHRRNMLDTQAVEFGFARAAGNLWALVLAKPC